MMITKAFWRMTTIIFVTTFLITSQALAFSDGPKGLTREMIGLFPAKDFQITTGRCQDCPTPPQALWYFQNELIAVPKKDLPVTGFSRTVPPNVDVLQWVNAFDSGDPLPYPPLIWIESPEILEHVLLSSDGKSVDTDNGKPIPFDLTPKIISNRSYYDDSTAAFFRGRRLRLRGRTAEKDGVQTFIARTIWPEEFLIEADPLSLQPLQADETLSTLIMANEGGTQSPFHTRLIWERHPGESHHWTGRAILGLLLSGAQGDDDEAQGGHFAVVTGRMNSKGEWHNWMVNNFYNLDEQSEKGIIAAPIPMDNYLMDLNSGQSYYRPAYLLVAVLNDDVAARRFQGAIERVYNHFYRHDFLYHHSRVNCTGISLDTLRTVGWNIPLEGPTSILEGIGSFLFLSIKDFNLSSGRKMYDYLTEERTRLYPRVAFEAAGNDLLKILGGTAESGERRLTSYEKELRDHLEAVIFLRIPQIPSSRAYGTYPVSSFDDYRHRVPADRSKWRTVQVGTRPFPSYLRDNAVAFREELFFSSLAVLIGLVGLGGLGFGMLYFYHVKGRKN